MKLVNLGLLYILGIWLMHSKDCLACSSVIFGGECGMQIVFLRGDFFESILGVYIALAHCFFLHGIYSSPSIMIQAA